MAILETMQYLIVCKQISCNILKMKLPTNYSLTNQMYNHLTVWKQMTDVKLNC